MEDRLTGEPAVSFSLQKLDGQPVTGGVSRLRMDGENQPVAKGRRRASGFC